MSRCCSSVTLVISPPFLQILVTDEQTNCPREHDQNFLHLKCFPEAQLDSSSLSAGRRTHIKIINILWHMGPFYNNRGMSANILAATNTGNRKTAVSMRRPVNTPALKNVTTIYGKLCFLCGLRQANARNLRTSIARQQSCEHASLTIEDGFSVGSVQRSYLEDNQCYKFSSR
jgi:hypothetical protein